MKEEGRGKTMSERARVREIKKEGQRQRDRESERRDSQTYRHICLSPLHTHFQVSGCGMRKESEELRQDTYMHICNTHTMNTDTLICECNYRHVLKACMCVHIHIYTHMNTYIYTYIHTHARLETC